MTMRPLIRGNARDAFGFHVQVASQHRLGWYELSLKITL